MSGFLTVPDKSVEPSLFLLRVAVMILGICDDSLRIAVWSYKENAGSMLELSSIGPLVLLECRRARRGCIKNRSPDNAKTLNA